MFSTYLSRGLFKPRLIFAHINGPIVSDLSFHSVLSATWKLSESNELVLPQNLPTFLFVISKHFDNLSLFFLPSPTRSLDIAKLFKRKRTFGYCREKSAPCQLCHATEYNPAVACSQSAVKMLSGNKTRLHSFGRMQPAGLIENLQF